MTWLGVGRDVLQGCMGGERGHIWRTEKAVDCHSCGGIPMAGERPHGQHTERRRKVFHEFEALRRSVIIISPGKCSIANILIVHDAHIFNFMTALVLHFEVS